MPCACLEFPAEIARTQAQGTAFLLHAGSFQALAPESATGEQLAFRNRNIAPAPQWPGGMDVEFIQPPFDPVVWSRQRIDALFDFEYKLEIYTPASKRRWGYYVLPMLLDGRLVGRFDLKTDRERGVLEVRAAHVEADADPADQLYPRRALCLADQDPVRQSAQGNHLAR